VRAMMILRTLVIKRRYADLSGVSTL